MMTILRFIFEKTALGKLLNNHKTNIGITFLVIWTVLQGLTTGLEQLTNQFPDMVLLVSLKTWVTALNSLLGQLAEFLGITLTGLGTVHAVDKLKRENAKK
jgi:hypothetical protein